MSASFSAFNYASLFAFSSALFLGPVIFQTYNFSRGGRVRAAIQLGAADRVRIESRCQPST